MRSSPRSQRELPGASYKDDPARVHRARPRGVPDRRLDATRSSTGWHTIEAVRGHAWRRSRSCTRQGWKLGILTNCDDDLFESTRPALGVEIDLVVTAEQVRSYKPALGHFERFEARHRRRAARTGSTPR